MERMLSHDRMKVPLISICLPNLNTRPFLEERMETILAQTFSDWELIICDSHSDDGSWEFFQKFAGDPRVRLNQVPREGIYAGWNECLKRARGRYLYIATSDDTASPRLLESLARPLEQLSNVGIAVCDYQAIDDQGEPKAAVLAKAKEAFFGEWLQTACIRNGKTEFLLHACFGTVWGTMTAVLFRSELLQKVGLFRTDRGSQADVEWSMRSSLVSDIVFVPGRLATWRAREGQATTSQNYDWRFVRTTLDCLEAALRDQRSGIPEEWKRIHNWVDEITAVWRKEYRDSFQLYRGLGRQHPDQFLRNAGAALQHQPKFLLQQILRGFPWSKELNPDHAAAARRLIELFHAPWPPQPLNHDVRLS